MKYRREWLLLLASALIVIGSVIFMDAYNTPGTQVLQSLASGCFIGAGFGIITGVLLDRGS